MQKMTWQQILGWFLFSLGVLLTIAVVIFGITGFGRLWVVVSSLFTLALAGLGWGLAHPQNEGSSRPERKRGGCLTALLIFLLVSCSFAIFLYSLSGFLTSSQVMQTYIQMQGWGIPAMILLGTAEFVFLIAVWNWKRWGVYGFGVIGLIVYGVNKFLLIPTVALFPSLAGIIILFLLVRPIWSSMNGDVSPSSDISLQHSRQGIVSFVLSLAVVLFLSIWDIATLGRIMTIANKPSSVVIGLFFMVADIFCLVGIGLGIAGIYQKSSKRIYAVLGLYINTALLVGLIITVVAPNPLVP